MNKKSWLSFILASVFLLNLSISGCVQMLQEGRVTFDDLKVKFTGSPYYIEDVVTGGPISDFGSHCGIKANLTDQKFLKLSYYSCLTANNAMFSQSWFSFEEKNKKREVHFEPWAISEQSVLGEGEALFIGYNTLLIYGKLIEPSEVELHVTRDNSIAEEGMLQECSINLYPLEKQGDIAVDHAVILPPFLRAELQETSLGKRNDVYRAFFPSFNFEIEGNMIKSTEELENFYLIVGFGDSRESAICAGAEGKTGVDSSSPENIISSIGKDWHFYLNFLEPNEPEYEQLFNEALTALRMNIYAPRGEMNYYGSVPCKVHYNFFWGWDTPFHALGYLKWKPELAKEQLRLQFSAIQQDGMLPHMLDDSLQPVSNISQPPVQGWVIQEIWEETGDTKFLREAYDFSSDYLKWFEKERDTDGDGLFEFHAPDETGWDDTPRYLPVKDEERGFVGSVSIKTIDALDLNCYIFMYYMNMADWAKILGKRNDARNWENKAEQLADRIDRFMWNEKLGCWQDLNRVGDSHEYVRVLTPVIWFPAWVGLTQNETRVKRVIEEHVLNPNEFFGEYPIPSVAYDSEYYEYEKEGSYWRGQIWVVNAYITYETLKENGYPEEALELKYRLLDMMSGKGGVYENYNALTGEVGWVWENRGDKPIENMPACFQFGWSAAFVVEMLLDELTTNVLTH
jgi:hypothetical protein